jgi:hypothetical protein
MRVLTENLMQREVRPSHHQQGVETSYTDFLATHPPTFIEAIDPLEADNWLRIIVSKFGLLHYTEYQNTLFMAQQLCGPVSAWWANFIAIIHDGHQVSWAEFRTAFHGYHIPGGLMAHKLQDFLHLQQGSSSVYEYSKKFNHLSQYGSYHADIDEKKISLFRQGLSHVLREHLTLFWSCTLNEQVSASIELCWTSLLVSFTSTLLSMERFLCSCHLSLISRHLSLLLLPRAWMRYLWFVNIRMCFPMIWRGCLLIGPSNSRSSYSLVLPLSISGHILWREMS